MSRLAPGEFQINDIVLDIPPSQISINRRSVNHSWQTLRTKSSIKTKSGYSLIDIDCVIKFTNSYLSGDVIEFDAFKGPVNGYDKLRALVSQLRLTPFCYVENKFLRDSIPSGGPNKSMALALKQCEIRTDTESTDCLIVTLRFAWFNYTPYIDNFVFREHIFSPKPVVDPRRSSAWKLFYEANQNKNGYDKAPRSLTTDLSLSFTRFRQLPVKDHNALKKEVKALKQLKEDMDKFVELEYSGLRKAMQDSLRKELDDTKEKWAETLSEELFGLTTSMAQDEFNQNKKHNYIDILTRVVDNQLDPEKTTKYLGIVDEADWKYTRTVTGEAINTRENPTVFKDDKSKDGFLLLEKEVELNTLSGDPGSSSDLITTGVSISFENILAIMPVVSQTYPTYQHIGSIDSVVTLSFQTNSDSQLQAISDFYDMVEKQHYDFRLVPAGQRNIKITNTLLNMFGLKEFIPENISLSTIPGQPGTHQVVLQLVDNPIDSKTQENIKPARDIFLRDDLRIQVVKVLGEHLRERSNLYITKLGKGDFADIPGGDAARARTRGLRRTGVPDKNIYNIFGVSLSDARQEALKEIMEDFREIMDETARELNSFLQETSTQLSFTKEGGPTANIVAGNYTLRKNVMDSSRMIAFMLMKDHDILGIERLQQTLVPSLKQNTEISSILSAQSPKRLDRVSGVELEGQSTTRDVALISLFELHNKMQESRSNLASSSMSSNISADNSSSRDEVLKQLALRREDTSVFVGFSSKKQEAGVVTKALGALTTVNPALVKRALAAQEPQWITANRLIDATRENDILAEHQRKVAKLIDDKIIASGLLGNPPFKKVLDAIMGLSNSLLSGSVNSYPDFPMSEVITKLGDVADKQSLEALKSLREDAIKQNILFKGLGLSSFVNPDFYIFGGINETAGNIVTPGVLQEAVQAIKASHRDRMRKFEKNWVEAIYEKHVISSPRAKLIKEKAGSTLIGEDFSGGVLVPSIAAKGDIAVSKIGYDGKSNPDLVKLNLRENPEPLRPCRGNDPSSPVVTHKLGFDVLEEIKTSEVWANKPFKDSHLNENAIYDHLRELDGIPQMLFPLPGNIDDYRKGHPPSEYPHGKRKLKDGTNRPHKGLDIPAAEGTPVYAPLDGEIIRIGWNNGLGNRVTLKHRDDLYTVYGHMQYPEDNPAFARLKEAFDKAKKSKRKVQVRRGTQIGGVANTGHSFGEHLHWEIRDGHDNRTAKWFDPRKYLSVATSPFQSPIDINGIMPGESILGKSVEQLENDIRSGQGPSLMRAYPTFKLYFIESDLGERKRFAFDDFFSYSSVKEIQVIRSRKVAADLCILQLTNISGVLSNRKFKNDKDPVSARTEAGTITKESLKPGAVNTTEENPIASLMLQPGIEIQLRLGYSNNPEALEKVFNGIIVETEFSEDDDLVTIICQSHAVELVQTVQGEVKKFGGILTNSGDTANVMEELLASPDVVHFGRWEPNYTSKNSALGAFTNKWTFFSTPADDNIWAPVGKGLLDIIYSPKYILYQTTIWDVMQEMTLRHPGYICSPVPYDGEWGARMTLFFGVPDQLYLSRDQTLHEEVLQTKLERAVSKDLAAGIEDIREKLKEATLDKTMKRRLEFIVDKAGEEDSAGRQYVIQNHIRRFALQRGFIKPFRRYHILTSDMHILYNNINNAQHNAFNTVTLQYEKGGSAGFIETVKGRPTTSARIDEKTSQLVFEDVATFSLKADAGIPDEETREMFAQFPNCIGDEQALRYSLSLLKNSLKEGYRGSIVTIGNPSIKPYDVAFIFDEYNDMYGPIEVEQVIHKFSQNTGFITEITPDMAVHVNELSTMSSLDVMGLITEEVLRAGGLLALTDKPSSFSPIGAMIRGNIIIPGNFVGAFIFKKLFSRTQLAHPFRYSPLVHNGKPMLGGVSFIKHTKGSFAQRADKWISDSLEAVPIALDDWWDTINPNNWARRSQGSVTAWLSGKER